jgi:Skp family chaperone for outer membrane proteins
MENTMATPSTARSYTEVGQQVSARLAPAQLQPLQTNADQIAHYIDRNGLNGLSVDDWMTAIWSLHAQQRLLWKVDPVEKSAKEKAAEDAKKEQARMVKDRSREQAVNNNTAAVAQAKAAKEAQELKSLRSQIRSRIESYRANHPSVGIDYARTESGQTALRSVLASKVGGSGSLEQLLTRVTLLNGKDALSAVSAAFFKMS